LTANARGHVTMCVARWQLARIWLANGCPDTCCFPANFWVKKKTFLEFERTCGNMTKYWINLYSLTFTRTIPVSKRHRCRWLPNASYGGDTNVRKQVFADQKKDRDGIINLYSDYKTTTKVYYNVSNRFIGYFDLGLFWLALIFQLKAEGDVKSTEAVGEADECHNSYLTEHIDGLMVSLPTNFFFCYRYLSIYWKFEEFCKRLVLGTGPFIVKPLAK